MCGTQKAPLPRGNHIKSGCYVPQTGFIAAMAADLAFGDYDKPTAAGTRLAEWIIVSTWGRSGDYLSLSRTNVAVASEDAAPPGLQPTATHLGILLAPGQDDSEAEYLLVRHRPPNVPVGGVFYPSDGLCPCPAERRHVEPDCSGPLCPLPRRLGWAADRLRCPQSGARVRDGACLAPHRHPPSLDRRVRIQRRQLRTIGGSALIKSGTSRTARSRRRCLPSASVTAGPDRNSAKIAPRSRCWLSRHRTSADNSVPTRRPVTLAVPGYSLIPLPYSPSVSRGAP